MYNLEDLPENIRSKIRVLDHHWIWLGHKTIYFRGKNHKITRIISHLLRGFDLSSPLQLNHKLECQIEYCCHPDCMYEGTQQDNMNDRKILENHYESKKTHCPLGHEYSISPSAGYRYCQICKNKRRNEWRKRNKEK